MSQTQTQAKTIYFGSDRETVTVVHKEPTIFRFSSAVKTISKTDSFSISPVDRNDPDYSKLKVVPHFRKSKDKVEFILDDGQVVKVLLAVVSGEMPSRTDSIFDFESKDSLLSRRDKRVFINEVELMKAMIKGSFVSGYKIEKLNKYVWSKEKNFKIKLLKLYVGEDLSGYVFKVTNTSRKSRRFIDVTKIKFGKSNLAVLAQVDNKVLANGSDKRNRSTFLRVVTKPTAVYSYLNLAFGAVKEGK